jgi:hypothetical protein
MHTNGDGRSLDACYNVQTVVDEKYKLIVDFDVSTCPDDKGALVTMTESAKEIMGVDEILATGDKGYFDAEDINKCEQSGTTCFVPKMSSGRNAPDEKYNKENFIYDKENDCYICPVGAILPFRGHKKSKRKDDVVPNKDYYNSTACKTCPTREKCTKSKGAVRRISCSPYEDTLDTVVARMKTTQGYETFRERKKIVEHPFGTTKAVWGYKQFLCRGKEKTTGEAALVFLAYNLRRVFNIFKENKEDLLEAMA